MCFFWSSILSFFVIHQQYFISMRWDRLTQILLWTDRWTDRETIEVISMCQNAYAVDIKAVKVIISTNSLTQTNQPTNYMVTPILSTNQPANHMVTPKISLQISSTEPHEVSHVECNYIGYSLYIQTVKSLQGKRYIQTNRQAAGRPKTCPQSYWSWSLKKGNIWLSEAVFCVAMEWQMVWYGMKAEAEGC